VGKERESQPWIALPEWQFAERILNMVSGQNSPVKQWRGGLTTEEIVAFAQSPQGLKPAPSPLSVRMALAYLWLLRHARKGNPGKKWAMCLLERKRPKVVAVALANKAARIAWALLLRSEVYDAPVV